MKNIIKISIILIMLIVINGMFSSIYAVDEAISAGDSFIAARDGETVVNQRELQKASNDIYNILFTIGVVLAFAVGMIIGIQFLVGSVDEKAKIKETLIPYVIGVFIVFSAFTIWKIAIEIGNDVAPTPEATGKPTSGSIERIDLSEYQEYKKCLGCGCELDPNNLDGYCSDCKKKYNPIVK